MKKAGTLSPISQQSLSVAVTVRRFAILSGLQLAKDWIFSSKLILKVGPHLDTENKSLLFSTLISCSIVCVNGFVGSRHSKRKRLF